MKKFIILFILLIALPCHAQDLARLGISTMGGGVGAAAPSCNASTNEVGDRSVEAGDNYIGAGYGFIFSVTADCSGNLKTAYVYHQAYSGAATGLLCVYPRVNATPDLDSSQSLLATSEAISCANSASSAWYSSNITGTHAVTNSGTYWLMVVVLNDSANPIYIKNGSNAGAYRQDLHLTACPATLGTGWQAADWSPFSAYVSIE